MRSNWDTIIGQERVKRILRQTLRNGRVAHAYLFAGADGAGAEALAVEFARTLLCERRGDAACGDCPSCRKSASLHHPDLRIVVPMPGTDAAKDDEGGTAENEAMQELVRQTSAKAADPYMKIELPKAKSILIRSVRGMKKEASLSSAEQGRKVFLVFDADAMNDAAANSFLKLLEEPLDDVHFVLTASSRDTVRQTIASRCQVVSCSLLSDPEVAEALSARDGVPPDQARIVARLAGGDFARARRLVSGDLQRYRVQAAGFLRSVLGASPLRMFEEQEEYLAGAKRDEAEQLLSMLHVWMRDAIVMREGSGTVINIDQEQDLRSFVAKFGTRDLERSLAAVERSLELLRRNVYLPLVMLSLIVQLRATLHAQHS